MFNKKRKQAEKQKRTDLRLSHQALIRALIAKADTLEDPAEKLLAFENIDLNIGDVRKHENKQIKDLAYNAETKVSLGGGYTTMALTVGSIPVLFIAPPVALGMAAAAFPAMIGTFAGASRREKSVNKKMKKEAGSHLETLDEMAQFVTDTKNDLIENRKDEITLSPFFGDVLKSPTLSEIFVEAAAQKISQLKEEAEAAQKAAAEAPATKPAPKSAAPVRVRRPLK